MLKEPSESAPPGVPIPGPQKNPHRISWRKGKAKISLSLPNAPLFSVVIPTTSRQQSLAETLGSLGKQSLPRDRFEVFVVVNGNTQKAFAPLQAEFRQLRNLHFLFLAERNVSIARNLGAQAARGSWLAFTDSDCLPPSDWLEQAATIIDRKKKLTVLGGPVLDHVPPGTSVPQGFQPQGWDHSYGHEERFLKHDEIHMECNLMITKAVFMEAGGFREDLGPGNRRFGFHEGTELQARIRRQFGERGVPFYSPKIPMLHTVRPGRMKLSNRLYRTFISGYDYARAFPQQGRSRAGLVVRILIQTVNFHWSSVFRPLAAQRILFRMGEITGQAFPEPCWFPTHVRPQGSPVLTKPRARAGQSTDPEKTEKKRPFPSLRVLAPAEIHPRRATNLEAVIFSSPKPFGPKTHDVQLTAMRSWRHFLPDCPIFLFGEDPTIAETCRKEGVELVGGISVCAGTDKPTLSRFFQKMERDYPHAMKIYLNSDIVLGPGVLDCLHNLNHLPGPWIASARRRCFPVYSGGARTSAEIERFLTHRARDWTWGPPWAMDVFVYRGLDLDAMPEFMIGHCAWDNWMIFNARNRGIMVVDCSNDLPLHHFDHEYGYASGEVTRADRDALLDERNLHLLGGDAKRFHLGHATHELRNGVLKKKKGGAVWQRNVELWRLQHPRLEREIKIVRSILHPFIRRWERNTTAREHHFQ